MQKRREIDVFFSDLSGLARTSTRLLGDNEANLIRVGEVTEPVLGLLADYSPEFPCLIRGAARYAPLLAKTFEGNEVKQYIELVTAQYDTYGPDDIPEYGEVGHGPWCSGLPNPPVPIGPNVLRRRHRHRRQPAHQHRPGLPQRPALRLRGQRRPGHRGASMSSGYAGTEADQAIVNAVLAGRSGRDADSYGALGSLLYGPVLRGGDASQ